jgi:hypothetical protein
MSDARRISARELAHARDDARDEASDDAERALGRVVAMGLPVATVIATVVAGVMGSLGSALLVLASGVMLGAIALLWASLRTLSGDAPLPGEHEHESHHERPGGTDLAERKIRVLLALKDLESEHALGKIDDGDFEQLVARYREEAKTVLREIDRQAEPTRAEAERVARDYLARHGFGVEPPSRGGADGIPGGSTPPRMERIECRACRTSNEPDAAFCKQCGSPVKVSGNSDAKV